MMAHDMGGKESGIPDLTGVSGLLIRSGGSSNPFPGSPLTPTHQPKNLSESNEFLGSGLAS